MIVIALPLLEKDYSINPNICFWPFSVIQAKVCFRPKADIGKLGYSHFQIRQGGKD